MNKLIFSCWLILATALLSVVVNPQAMAKAKKKDSSNLFVIAAFGNWKFLQKNLAWKVAKEIERLFLLHPYYRAVICKVPVEFDLIGPTIDGCLAGLDSYKFILGVGEFYDPKGEALQIELVGRNVVRKKIAKRSKVLKDNYNWVKDYNKSAKKDGHSKVKDIPIDVCGAGMLIVDLPMDAFICGGNGTQIKDASVSANPGEDCCNAMTYLCSMSSWRQRHKRPSGFIHVNRRFKAPFHGQLLYGGLINLMKRKSIASGTWLGRTPPSKLASDRDFRRWAVFERGFSPDGGCEKYFWGKVVAALEQYQKDREYSDGVDAPLSSAASKKKSDEN